MAQENDQQPGMLTVDGQKPLILIVDDNPTNLAMLAELIDREGGEVRAAINGTTALRYANLTPQPDLILLDIMMPGMDGHAVLAELQKNPVTRDIPVIFVTARDTQEDEERGIREGAVDYLTKPIKYPILLARARTHINLHRAQRLLANQKNWLEQEVTRRVSENAQLENRLKLTLESTGFGIWEHDYADDRTHWSAGLIKMLGYAEAPASIGDSLARIHPEDRQRFEDSLLAEGQHGRNGDALEIRIRHRDGSWRWVEIHSHNLGVSSEGKPQLTVGTMLDISARKIAEADHLLSEMVFSGITDGICITDARRQIIKVNPAFSRITGYSLAEVQGQNPRLLKSGVHGDEFYTNMWQTLERFDNWQGEITNRRKDGSLLNEWLSISGLRGRNGEITHYVGFFSDLSEREEAAQRIQYLSSYDTLTELPNRNLFADRLEQALLTARRYERSTALILLDIDRFRFVNDTLGPPAGDQLLVEIARRLRLQIRDGDTLGRRSGNEFGFVMANLHHEHDALALAQRMLNAIAVPLQIAGQPLVVTASIGICVFPKDGSSSEALFKSADTALLRAKQAGRNTFRFYSPEMDADAARRLGLETELRGALERHELSVYYQPQISLDSGQMIGMEALLRWHSPLFGQVSPAEFIPIAEESGLIVSIGEWVLRTACQQTKRWLDLGLLQLRIAVNLSPRQFRDANLLAMVADALAESQLPAGALELEITESAFIDDLEEAVVLCRKLKEIGVKLSLDDFGTGYSSLAYVSRFPFDKLKIDQSFVRDITENPVNAAIATAAIVMARSLNLSVLAEGVETEAQASFLRSRRCDAIQGYLFSRAVPADEFAPLLRQNRHLPLAAASTGNGHTLLLVDDEPNILNALTRLLRREGYTILACTSPLEAFDLLAKHDVQVVISDQRMPDMSGTEFLARVRQLYPNTVRLVLTGYTDLDSVTGAINRGAIYKFLTKPWDDDLLRDEIREACRKATQIRELPDNGGHTP